MLCDIAPLETGEGAHPDIVKLREQEGVDKVPALDRELRIIDCFLGNLEPRRPGTEKSAASSPIKFRLCLARPGDEKGQIGFEKVMPFDHVRIAFPDQVR